MRERAAFAAGNECNGLDHAGVAELSEQLCLQYEDNALVVREKPMQEEK